MIRREKKIYEFSLIISLESLINRSVWGWGGVFSVTSGIYKWLTCLVD